MAASSTGKFHPEYALGSGGLVRHTKAAVKIAHELLQLEMYRRYASDEQDLMLVALMLHDGWKHGTEDTAGKYTVANHPTVCSEWIRNSAELTKMLPREQISFLCDCIASHMGQWNTDYRSKKEILPKPVTAAQKFVHQADYLASRKYLLFDFGDDYYRPQESEPAKQTGSGADELSIILEKIVAKCKEQIAAGVDRTAVYEAVSANNNGNRNPNSITDKAIAEKVLNEVGALKTG